MHKYFDLENGIDASLENVKMVSEQVEEQNELLAYGIEELRLSKSKEEQIQKTLSTRKSARIFGRENVENFEKDHVLKMIQMAREKGENSAEIKIRESQISEIDEKVNIVED